MNKKLTLAAGLGVLLASATAYALTCKDPVSVSALTPIDGAPSGLCLRHRGHPGYPGYGPTIIVLPCNDTTVFDDQVYKR